MAEDITQFAITWKHTGNAKFPYTAEVRDRTYTIRINDFPAEPLYTLLCGGEELTNLEDWPPAWEMPSPPKALLDLLTPKIAPRHEGAVRLAATSAPGDRVEGLALADDHVVAGSARCLDLATLRERPPKPLERPALPPMVLDAEERTVALAPELGLAITALRSTSGDEVRVHVLGTGKKRGLAVGQRTTAAASISPDRRFAIVLDEEGGVLCFDLWTGAYPGSARARNPARGKRASVDVARGGRLWLAATGPSIEVRLMTDEKAVATVDLAPVGEDVTSAMFLPDASGFVVGTARGVVMRFELLLDRIGSGREARLAAVADAVDAAMSEGRWLRFEPRIEVYDEATEGGRTTLYFVADHYEYNHAQSGSDWAEHLLCAGHATFEGERRVEVQVTSTERRRLTEREDETYDARSALAEFRTAAARSRITTKSGS